jgi:integrase
VYQRSDGRWVAELDLGIVDGKRKRPRRYCKTKREAQQALADMKRQHEQGVDLTAERQTVAQFLQTWLDTVIKPHKRSNTYISYERMSRVHLIPHLGHILLHKLTAQHVQRMVSTLQERGDLSARTIEYSVNVLQRGLEQAVRWGLVARNVARLVSTPKVERRPRRVFDFDEAQHFLAVVEADQHAQSRAALYRLAITLGIRQGELLDLCWADIDFEAGTLTIQEGKTAAARRRLPLSDTLTFALQQRRRAQREEQLIAAVWHEDNLVFTTERGTRISPNSLRSQFKRLLRKAELPFIPFHSLRHTAISLMARARVPLGEVQQIVGHKRVATTLEIYTHYAPNDLREAVNHISERLTRSA